MKAKIPTRTTARAKPATPQPRPRKVTAAGVKRLTLDIPADIHRAIKICAAEKATTISELVISAVQKQYLTGK